jgi:hypothetical protein
MDYAGEITNLRPPPPKTNIRVLPYVLGSYDHYQGYDASVKKEQYNAKLGGEVKWAINTNDILDLTANTDFAQVDADQQVNNVTRFSVFFPEKRQFFLENASLFGFGIAGQDDGSGARCVINHFSVAPSDRLKWPAHPDPGRCALCSPVIQKKFRSDGDETGRKRRHACD